VSSNGWHRVDPADVPDDGRVRSVVVDGFGYPRPASLCVEQDAELL
jgi:hypothetical protein